MTTAKKIDFWFDPGCPYTWRTSRWLTDVAERRGLDVHWHVMSLAILNEGKEIPPQFLDRLASGRVATRVLQAVRDAHGNAALGRFYTEVGGRVHERDGEFGPDVYREALAAAGLPVELADAGDAPGFFGPIVSPTPTGDEASRLFDAIVLLSGIPSFSELKRARQGA